MACTLWSSVTAADSGVSAELRRPPFILDDNDAEHTNDNNNKWLKYYYYIHLMAFLSIQSIG